MEKKKRKIINYFTAPTDSNPQSQDEKYFVTSCFKVENWQKQGGLFSLW